jgi:hypothetical protein
MSQLRATVSGSFTRHLAEVQHAVAELKQRGVRVLSPEQPTIVDAVDGFLFVASDNHRSVKLVQDRHLASIAASDFLWLENSDGHVGQSAALELGFAVAMGIPVYGTSLPNDLTMRQYVRQVPDIAAAISLATERSITANENGPSLLLDPVAATADAALGVTRIRHLLTRHSNATSSANLHKLVSTETKRVVRALKLPVTNES